MANARDIVQQYFTAFYGGDAQSARQYLVDNLSFSGPAATFSTADEYLKATEHAVRAVKGLEKHKVFVDGRDVCIIYDLLVDNPVGSIAIAEWYHLGKRIASIRTILDTGPFNSTTGETVVDLVCRMTVVMKSAPATRTYAGETYYFCNPGCAEAFDRQPESWVVVAA